MSAGEREGRRMLRRPEPPARGSVGAAGRNPAAFRTAAVLKMSSGVRKNGSTSGVGADNVRPQPESFSPAGGRIARVDGVLECLKGMLQALWIAGD
eukprot:13248301-Alexandrium_andersonii.AAC.1